MKSKIKKLENKFNTIFSWLLLFWVYWRIKNVHTTKPTERWIDQGHVIIHTDHIEILKESMFLKRDMGSRKLYFKNITSIDRNKKVY